MVTKVNIHLLHPYLKPFAMLVSKQFFFFLVVPSKLSWGRTFENFISGLACLIWQYGPNY